MTRLFVAAEREALGRALERLDLNVPRIEIDGERDDPVWRCETTSNSAVGPVGVGHRLYRHPSGGRRVCPLALHAGIIEGYWTPLAAKPASWAVAHLTPKESEARLDLRGQMTPCKRTLDRLPKVLNWRWEAQRLSVEATWCQEESVPAEAVSMGVSLDGVRVARQDGDRQGKRDQAQAQGTSPRGPAAFQEVGGGTIAFDDRAGEWPQGKRLTSI